MTDIRPMLAKPADLAVEKYIGNRAWMGQLKMDGQRLGVKLDPESRIPLQTFSRTGKPVNIEPGLRQDLESVVRHGQAGLSLYLDGELMPDGKFWVFDILASTSATPQPLQLRERLRLLDLLRQGQVSEYLEINPWETTEEGKQHLWNLARENGLEGLVFKRLNSIYRSGVRSDDWRKVKLVKSVDAVITAQNLEGKTNFQMSVCDPESNTWIEVGTVSGLTGDGPRIKVGDVVEVTCLYASLDNRLVQPVAPKIRLDKNPLECTLDQLQSIYPNRDYSNLLKGTQ